MKIVIAGGTGFLGRPLAQALRANGHDIATLARHGADLTWQPDGTARGPWTQAVSDADVIINLAGKNLAEARWTTARKQEFRDSRILSTRSLVAAIREAAHKPRVLINGSAVGYYGDPGERPVDESSPPGNDFLATLCVDWETEARAAEALDCRVVILRTGIPLDKNGGALKRMIPPFQWFIGGVLGSGTQYVSWIHLADWLALTQWVLDRPNISGAVNATAPDPVTNRELSRALGRALHRPSWLPVPAFGLRLLIGEMADVALLDGQRVIPKRAIADGFEFRYPTIEKAMAAIFRPR